MHLIRLESQSQGFSVRFLASQVIGGSGSKELNFVETYDNVVGEIARLESQKFLVKSGGWGRGSKTIL